MSVVKLRSGRTIGAMSGEELSMKLGQRLRELRQGRDLTLLQLSNETSLSVSYLSDMERGRTTPSLDTLEKIASFYQMPLGQLMASVDGWLSVPIHDIAPGLEELIERGDI